MFKNKLSRSSVTHFGIHVCAMASGATVYWPRTWTDKNRCIFVVRLPSLIKSFDVNQMKFEMTSQIYDSRRVSTASFRVLFRTFSERKLSATIVIWHRQRNCWLFETVLNDSCLSEVSAFDCQKENVNKRAGKVRWHSTLLEWILILNGKHFVS